MASDQLLHTFGALYVGSVFTFILFGFATLQVYLYFYLYSRDGIWKKILVFSTWFAHATQIGFLAHALYHYFIANFSNEDSLGDGYWSLYAALVLNLPNSIIVQLFFTKRVFALASTRPEWKAARIPITSIVVFLVLAGHLAPGVALTAKTISLGRVDRLPELKNYVIATAAGHVASEIGISGSLSVMLIKSRTDFRRTNDLLQQLMVYAIQRSLFTSILTAVGAVAFATNMDSLWFLALEFVIASAHLNSMLGALNHRANLRSARSDAESGASADMLGSGYSGVTPKTHSRNGSFQPSHLRGLSYGSASPPSSHAPLRTPPISPGFMVPGAPGGMSKSGWPAPSYPPSNASSWAPTHLGFEAPLTRVTVERETVYSDATYVISEPEDQQADERHFVVRALPQRPTTHPEVPRTPTSNSPFMQTSFTAI